MEHIKIFSRTRIVPRRKIALYHDIQNELLKGSSWEEIKQKKNLTDEWISAILEAAPEISLQQPIANDKEKKIEDVAPDDQPEPEQMIAQKRASRHLEELLRSCLTPKQERVIRDRFGLNLEGKIYRLKEIGDHLSTSAEAIRQLQNKALEKLKGKKDEILYQFFET